MQTALHDLAKAAAAKVGATGNATALYLSAGTDTQPFVFLQRAFLDDRGLSDMPAPDVFIYVDREGKSLPVTETVVFEDDRTLISTTPLGLIGDAGISRVSVQSDRAEFCRDVAVVGIRDLNQAVLAVATAQEWHPDVLITVCDGCRFGGQDPGRCEAVPVLGPDRSGMLITRGTRWWVTDHFSGVEVPDEVKNGDVIVPTDRAVPFALIKRAKLSSSWGHRNPPWLGATAFGAVDRP